LLYCAEMAETLIHEILPVGLLQCNCHILGDPETGEALVVDPGDEIGHVQELLQRHGLKVCAIVSTHAHIDHVGGLARLQKETGAPVLLHAADADLYAALPEQARWIGMPPPEQTRIDGFLSDGEVLRWGRLQATVLHTPGHSPGSVCLLVPAETAGVLEVPRLLAGDTLFAGSVGRTDLWGGSFQQLMRSLREKILVLPDHTRVYPGHGPATTLGVERETNPFLQGL
jgi:hydroxyacylglutathione hydrolase